MRYGSVCSGIEAASVAWSPLGWKPEWLCEFAPFPSAVLRYRYPDVVNLHDMLNIEKKEIYHERPIDLLVGGTPCQSFSVAGIRKGLDDARGNLALKFCQILRDKQPRWFIWENVPGVLSSNGGRDFAAILSGFRECGYGFSYRVLDAQHFGVPQRRRRVFVVGYLGDWRPPAAVLFERESLYGNTEPSRKKTEDTPSFTLSGFGAYREGVGTLKASGGDLGGGSENLIYSVQGNLIGRSDSASPNGLGVQEDVSYTLNATDRHVVLAINTMTVFGRPSDDLKPRMGMGIGQENDPQNTLSANHSHGVFHQNVLRKHTPRECERLMGFPDDWTLVPYRGKPAEECLDGPRYTACGNSMAVPVMKWLGWRVDTVSKLILANEGLFEMSRHNNLP